MEVDGNGRLQRVCYRLGHILDDCRDLRVDRQHYRLVQGVRGFCGLDLCRQLQLCLMTSLHQVIGSHVLCTYLTSVTLSTEPSELEPYHGWAETVA